MKRRGGGRRQGHGSEQKAGKKNLVCYRFVQRRSRVFMADGSFRKPQAYPWTEEIRNPVSRDPVLLLELAGKVRLALSDLQALQVLLGQVITEPVLLLQQRQERVSQHLSLA